MSRILRKVFGKARPRVSPGHEKAANEDSQLVQSVRDGPTSTPTVNALELELAEEKIKRTRLEHEHQRARAEADALADTKRQLEDAIREVKGFMEARERVMTHKDASLQQLEKDMNEMKTKLAESRTAAEHARGLAARLSEMDQLLSERTAELSAAQAFLTKVDAVSEAEVVGMVENLNTLISSASGALSLARDQREPVPGTLVEEAGFKEIRDYFGNAMFEQIVIENSVAVNLAVNTHIGRFVEGIISGWGGGEAAGTLGEIYKMIFTKESQTIASRWRALTKRYIPHQEPPRGEDIVGDLARILMITRTFSDFSGAMESVENSAGSEIRNIIEAALQLDDTIKTKIASCDMSVYIVTPGAIFDEELMANEFGDDGIKGEDRIVAGTMEVGLLRRSGNTEKVLRKPKVILEGDLVEPEESEQ